MKNLLKSGLPIENYVINLTKEIRDAIRDYYRQLIDENIGSPKKMWKAINKVLGKKGNSVKLLSVEIEGKYLTREHDILEALNQHFISVGPILAKKITAKPGDDSRLSH